MTAHHIRITNVQIDNDKKDTIFYRDNDIMDSGFRFTETAIYGYKP